MNPLTPIEVCNNALLNLGSGYSINSFDDTDSPSRACRTYYPQARRSLLAYDRHDFSFATTTQNLVQIAGKPNWYQLPSDMVRTIAIDGDERRNFYVMRDQIHTEISNPTLIYIADDPSLKWYPPDAVDAVIFYLSAKLAIALRNDQNMSSAFLQMAEAKCQKVATADVRNLRLDSLPTFQSEIIGSR